ncbi:hypothetical protein MHPYR_160049 [uncultured Mycobacterium sp.]|uniref:Uncharacterized protein n=1 Tax=uncultured Mycobacterium sp. TaxID=171292 RepID=A0A1Y5P3E9_9MYCO|nr:hypothetical protein MHPYR_160049 [uncultured Mycobacterium sp.]
MHGGFHAGWCWERTIAELDRLGHDAVAWCRVAAQLTIDGPLQPD